MDENDTVADGTDAGFSRVPIEISVMVGRARPKVRDLLQLRGDSVLPLDRRIEDPVELYVGEQLIALGELIEMDPEEGGQLGVRLTEVCLSGRPQ